jgi:uncharacterized surface protein with fasciclin (FAS1) repeats
VKPNVLYLKASQRVLVQKGSEISSIARRNTSEMVKVLQGCNECVSNLILSVLIEDSSQKVCKVNNVQAVKRKGEKVLKIHVSVSSLDAKDDYAEMSTDFDEMTGGFGTFFFHSNSWNNDALPLLSLLDIMETDPELTTLLAAVKAAGLDSMFSSSLSSYTLFAPTNAAFEKLPDRTLEDLLKPKNKHKLIDILSYHVVQDKVYAEDVVKSKSLPTLLKNKNVKVRVKKGNVFVNNAIVVTTDVEAQNGIIHKIDNVLLPSE